MNNQSNINTFPQWILCSEKLPEEDVEVLISYAGKYVKIAYVEQYNDLKYWVITGHTVVPIDYVTAWMPRPEPYKS